MHRRPAAVLAEYRRNVRRPGQTVRLQVPGPGAAASTHRSIDPVLPDAAPSLLHNAPAPRPVSGHGAPASTRMAYRVSRPMLCGGDPMTLKSRLPAAMTMMAGVIALSLAWVDAQGGGRGVAIDPDDIGGVVTSVKGPEAGVWVIARPPTFRPGSPYRRHRRSRPLSAPRPAESGLQGVRARLRAGRFAPVNAKPGAPLDLKAAIAPDAKSAAQIYPAELLVLAARSCPRDGKRKFVGATRGCLACHQLGDLATRTIPKSSGTFNSHLEAWDHRVGVGPVGPGMAAGFKRLGEARRVFAEWTERVAAGATPKQLPPRPAGLERNLVVSLWDWSDPTGGRSDAIATDDRHPTLNANGLIYGAIQTADTIATLDPAEHRAGTIKVPSHSAAAGTRRAVAVLRHRANLEAVGRSAQRGDGQAGARAGGLTGPRAGQQQPAFCRDGAVNKYAKYFPVAAQSARQVSIYDPKEQAVHAVRHVRRSRSQSLLRGRQPVLRSEQPHSLGRRAGVRPQQGCPGFTGLVSGGPRHQRRRQDHRAGPSPISRWIQEGSSHRVRLLFDCGESG